MLSPENDLEIRNQQYFNNEINLKEISYLILRNKKIIILFSIIGFLFGVINALSTPRQWQGQFQIAIDNKSDFLKVPSLDLNSRLANLLPITGGQSSLETEVEILSSPSVLIEVFNYVKSQKNKDKSKAGQVFRFDSWKKNLSIELVKKTSILNLEYIDQDKELIIPVLNKISNKYQKYSGKKREKNLTRGINYYKNQIELYREKSNNSIKEAEEYAISNDLMMIPKFKDSKDKGSSVVSPLALNVEFLRVEAASEIRFFSEMLKQLDLYESNPDEIVSFANSLGIKDSFLINDIKKNESELTRLRETYLDNDILVQSALSRKKVLLNALLKLIRDDLNAKRNLAKAKLNSAERPEGVLNKFRLLQGNVIKDQNTLAILEAEYRGLELEFAKIKEPWELITEPTLTPNPVGQSRKSITALGLITGLLTGLSIAFIKEKRTGAIFKLSELEAAFDYKNTELIKYNKNQNWENFFQAISLINLAKLENDFCLFFIGNFIDNAEDEIYKQICKYKNSKNVKKTNILVEAINYDNILVISSLGRIKRDYFEFINKKFKKINKKPIGLIVVDQINK